VESKVAPRFSNPDPAHRPHDLRAVFRWGVLDRLAGRRQVEPAGPAAPRVSADIELIRRQDGGPRLTWIGHASFLGALGGGVFLVDPVFSQHIAWTVRRHGRAGLTAADLPRLDALLVTHSHYDHLDTPSIRALPRDVSVFAPLGLGGWFRRLGFENVAEMGWWDSARAGPLEITFVPSRHWSRRWFADTNHALWGGFIVAGGGVSVYHGGDTAWFNGFEEIARRFPGLAAAMIPVGAYRPAWFMEHHHLNPEQAGRAFLSLGARRFIPMHWGAFQLADEPLCEPADRVRRWWEDASPDRDRRLVLMAVGQTVDLDA
jgi:L-ascorbate metabolism protein UlaG (beta-lactamase superfamily)